MVLVGHSMAGMTVMALADQHPELFRTKLIGAVLISTAAGTVDPATWLPARSARGTGRDAVDDDRGVQGTDGRRNRARPAASDIAFLGTRRIGFGDPHVSPTLVDFLERVSGRLRST